jgi:CBS domain-containing protein
VTDEDPGEVRRSLSGDVLTEGDRPRGPAYPMRHHGVTALAVLDGDRSTRPIGMITKTDITQAAAEGEDLNKVLIGQLISQSPGSDQPQLAQR